MTSFCAKKIKKYKIAGWGKKSKTWKMPQKSLIMLFNDI